MKKIFTLIITSIVVLSAFAQEYGVRNHKQLKMTQGLAMPKNNFSKLTARGAISNDTVSFGHHFYTAVYAKANGFNCPGNLYSTLGTTSVNISWLTNYVVPKNDALKTEIFTVYDTIFDVGLSQANKLVKKAYIMDSAVSVLIDTVTILCGLDIGDTTIGKRSYVGDSISFSLYTVDKATKVRGTLLKQIHFTSNAELDSFYNDGLIYTANVPFNTTLPAGTSAFGILIEYKTKHTDSNFFGVCYNRMDSCGTVTLNGQSFSSPSMRPIFPNYTQWVTIDSVSPTTANKLNENNGFAYSIATIPANCRYVYTQNFYVMPRAIMVNKFAGFLITDPVKTSFCANSKVLISPNFTGGREPFTQKWTATTGTIDVDTDPAIELTLGTTNSTVKLVLKDSFGDSIVMTKVITVSNPATSVALSKPNLTSCADIIVATATMTGGTASSYSWSNGGSSTNKLNITAPGAYSVTVTSSLGCTATATSATVGSAFLAPPVLNFTVTPTNKLCPKRDINFDATGAITSRPGWNITFKDGATSMGTGIDLYNVVYQFSASGAKTVYMSADSAACVAAPVSKAVTIATCASIQENNSLSDNVKVYPNPIRNGAVNVQNDMNQTLNIKITDLLGKVIVTERVSGNKTENIDMSSTPNGVYFIEVEGKNERTIKKVIVDNKQ